MKTTIFHLRLYTGPMSVQHVASAIRSVPGAFDVLEGTEHVLFSLRTLNLGWGFIQASEDLRRAANLRWVPFSDFVSIRIEATE